MAMTPNLKLTRYVGQWIWITLPDGRTVRLLVHEITDRGQVRLGIDAPRDIEVHREEVWERNQR